MFLILASEVGNEVREGVRGFSFGVLRFGLCVSVAEAMVTVFAVRRTRETQGVEVF